MFLHSGITKACLVSPKLRRGREIRDTVRCGSNPKHQALRYGSCVPGELRSSDGSGHRQGDLGHIYPSLPAGPRSQIKVLADGPASRFADNHLLVSIHGGQRRTEGEKGSELSWVLSSSKDNKLFCGCCCLQTQVPTEAWLQVPPYMSLPLPLQTPTAIRWRPDFAQSFADGRLPFENPTNLIAIQ